MAPPDGWVGLHRRRFSAALSRLDKGRLAAADFFIMKANFSLLRRMVLVAIAGAAPAAFAADAPAPTVEVWKTPTCSCCAVWVRHLEEAGLQVKVTQMNDLTPIRRQFRVPPQLSSCHTARVEGYVVEGHVPAEDILRLLQTRPQITGIYVPGMPIGSPGMEGPGAEPYDVLALEPSGRTSVFATHKP